MLHSQCKVVYTPPGIWIQIKNSHYCIGVYETKGKHMGALLYALMSQ